MKLSPIIQPSELISLSPAEFILFDASAGSKDRYDEQHLAGAYYIDLNTDLANIGDFAIGGRHPLPIVKQFAEVLGKFGINEHTHVIIYDDKKGSNAAARFWWMLRSVGHEKVQVVNGGFQAAVKAGFTVDNLKPKAKSANSYPTKSWQLPMVAIDEVEVASKTGNQTIIDVRDANRYAGLTEPIDLIAGHIPGTINFPFTQSLDEHGAFYNPKVLKKVLEMGLENVDLANTIVHCGSGVTACHLLLAMDYAGLEIPKLYVGSWSEWSRNNKEMVLAK